MYNNIHPIENNTDILIDIEKAKNNSPTLKIVKDNIITYLHSAYSPEREAIRLTENIVLEKDSILICFGLGLGYHISAILHKCGDNNRIIAIEPSKEIFLKSYREKKLSELQKYKIFTYIISENKFEIQRFLEQSFSEMQTSKIKVFIHPAYERLFPKECENFLQCIKETILVKKVDLATALCLSEDWQTRMLDNIPFVLDSYHIGSFKNEFKGEPILLVAGGPSLNKNVEYLKYIKNKITIICMYTAYKVLKSHNIEPDFIIALDSNQTMLESSADSKERINIPLIYLSFLDTKLLQKHDCEKIFITDYVSAFIPQLLEKVGFEFDFITTGGSVACTSLSVAKYLGASQIILIGQDLSFIGNESHAKGTYYDDKNEFLLNESNDAKKLFVEGINGEKLRTVEPYLSFKSWIEQFIEENKNKIEFIDATEGGALIKGTKIMTLEQAFENYKNNDPDFQNIDIKNKINSIFKKDKMLTKRQQGEFIERFKKVYEDTYDLVPVIEEGISIWGGLLASYEQQNNIGNLSERDRLFEKLDEIDGKIWDKKDVLLASDLNFFKITLNVNRIKDDEILSNDLNIITQNLALYKGMKELVVNLRLKLKKIIANEFSGS